MKITVRKITLMAIMTALSLTIYIVESLFPISPIGGIKLGLANVVTLAAMLFIGRREAGLVLLARITLAAVFYGTIFSFAFSLVGGLFAYLIMCLLIGLSDKKQIWVVSVFGGLFHNFGQLIVACVITGQTAVFALAPYLIVSGIITGAFTGLCAQRLWFSPLSKFKEQK